MMQAYRTEGNYRSAARLSPAELRAAIFRKIGTAARKLEAGVPVRWRLEVLTCFPLLAHLVIGHAFFRVFEYGVGFAYFLETYLGLRVLADIRMVLACQFSIGVFDFVLRCVTRNAKSFVVVLEFHGFRLGLIVLFVAVGRRCLTMRFYDGFAFATA